MSSSTIGIYASRETMVSAVRWTGSDSSYGLIKHWAKKSVDRDSRGLLLLQTDEGVESVAVGNYILLVSGSFFQFTPQELDVTYVEVREEM